MSASETRFYALSPVGGEGLKYARSYSWPAAWAVAAAQPEWLAFDTLEALPLEGRDAALVSAGIDPRAPLAHAASADLVEEALAGEDEEERTFFLRLVALAEPAAAVRVIDALPPIGIPIATGAGSSIVWNNPYQARLVRRGARS